MQLKDLKLYLALWLMPDFSKTMWRTLLQKDFFTISEQLEFLANLTPRGSQKNVDKITNVRHFARIALDDIQKLPYYTKIARHLDWLDSNASNFITTYNEFPTALKQIKDPPILLCGSGDKKILHTNCIAMVGSRRASLNAENIALEFAEILAQNNLTVVSGLALGIDGKAHFGAIKTGKTIGVMATGMDIIYPKKHIRLAEQILATGGAIISEMPLGTAPMPRLFPVRNRIIIGLSLGTFVVEAGLKSGSLISARLANESGRSVYAAPSSLNNPGSAGTNKLLQDGAIMVLTAEDILQDLEPQLQTLKNNAQYNYNNAEKLEFNFDAIERIMPSSNNLAKITDKNEQIILQKLDKSKAISTDNLFRACDLSIDELKINLQKLELQNYIQQTAGGWIKL